ncbi:MAG: glycosyltransferase family 2 protein [Syntrophobacteraceae bacterium]
MHEIDWLFTLVFFYIAWGSNEMVLSDQPLVSIVTPVYNGEKYLAECIESVLAQTYRNWDYTIVNNCSTDKSLAIAQDYAGKDQRIKVYSNKHFVGATENHNIAFRLVNPDSKYCKVVSADDWIYPECISKLVDLAERYPNVEIVGSHSFNTQGMSWNGLSPEIEIFEGRHICRLFLLGLLGNGTFGLPSTVLYRSYLVRSEHAFFSEAALSPDVVACLNCLQASDFGFVHQVLSFERLHDGSVSAKIHKLNGYCLNRIEILKEFGPVFLTNDEFKGRMKVLLSDYYNMLAGAFISLRNKEFWDFHRERLTGCGYTFYGRRLAKGFCRKLLESFLNPKQTMDTILRRINTNFISRIEKE